MRIVLIFDFVKSCSRTPRPVNISTRFNTFDAFRHRNYRFLWCGTALFSAGFWLQQVVVGWLAYEITGSPLMTSIALGLDALPILFGAPLGGLLSDKYDKKLLLAM
ncbi:MAG: MFS transporter, partial [SAR202 cluster bacterium]|nr:MFS transporter [SAR202 cluster bacterium]